VMRLPAFLQPDIKRYAFVIALDQNGRVPRNLQDTRRQSASRKSPMSSSTMANFFWQRW